MKYTIAGGISSLILVWVIFYIGSFINFTEWVALPYIVTSFVIIAVPILIGIWKDLSD